MGIRYNKRIKINDWLNLNISKSGPTLSVGPKGAKVNIGPSGAKVNAGIPGTGVSYNKKIGSSSTSSRSKKGKSKSDASSSKTYWLLIAAVALIYAGQSYEQFAAATYAGIGLAVIYLVVVLFQRKQRTTNNAQQTTENKQNHQPSAQREEEKETYLSESQREQLRDRMANSPDLQTLGPYFIDAAKLVVHYQEATPALLKEKLGIATDAATTLLHQLELVGIVGMERTDGTRSLIAKNDSHLAEIFDVVIS